MWEFKHIAPKNHLLSLISFCISPIFHLSPPLSLARQSITSFANRPFCCPCTNACFLCLLLHPSVCPSKVQQHILLFTFLLSNPVTEEVLHWHRHSLLSVALWWRLLTNNSKSKQAVALIQSKSVAQRQRLTWPVTTEAKLENLSHMLEPNVHRNRYSKPLNCKHCSTTGKGEVFQLPFPHLSHYSVLHHIIQCHSVPFTSVIFRARPNAHIPCHHIKCFLGFKVFIHLENLYNAPSRNLLGGTPQPNTAIKVSPEQLLEQRHELLFCSNQNL